MAKLHYQEASEEEKKDFSSLLSEDEELILVTSYGKTYLRSIFIVALLWPGIIPFLLSLGVAKYFNQELLYGFIVGLIFMVVVAYLKTMHTLHGHRYLLTTRRVIIKRGIFTVSIASALYDKITHIEVDQSFLDKVLMHYGTIKVHTAGTNKDEMMLQYVDYPLELKNMLERLINREREKFGLRSEPVVAMEGELL